MNPGDRVTITGIYRVVGSKPNPRQRSVRAVYSTHVDMIYAVKDENDTMQYDAEGNLAEDEVFLRELSEERKDQIQHLGSLHDVYQRCSDAIAPGIFENEDIKKALLLQLLGGTPKDFALYK